MATRWSERLSSLHRISFDSNALIYASEGISPYAGYVGQALEMLKRGEARGFISTIVEMEMLVKPLQERNVVALDRIELFLRDTPNLFVRGVDRTVARRAAGLRARLHPMDAIIAATALVERCDALIGNDAMMASKVIQIPYLYLNDYV